jgi:hypothetical protein
MRHTQQCMPSFAQLPTWSRSLELVYKPDKLKPCAQGPYDIIVVHTNGTLTIQWNAHTTECISIRNVKPFQQN